MASVGSHLSRFAGYVPVLGVPQTLLLYAGRAFKVRGLTLRCRGIASAVVCRPAVSDFHGLRHIFVDHDSDVPMEEPPKLIIDGGANVGYASVLFANKYPDARILAVEPDDENGRLLQQNCSRLPNVELLKGGIWGRRCRLRIANPHCDPQGFRVVEADDPESSMPAYTVDDLIERSGQEYIDILKLDVEGAEVNIFSAANLGWLDRTRVLSIETHGAEAERVVRAAMERHDFSCAVKGEKLVFRNNRLAGARLVATR
jgi:FkbM family methyltransferase